MRIFSNKIVQKLNFEQKIDLKFYRSFLSEALFTPRVLRFSIWLFLGTKMYTWYQYPARQVWCGSTVSLSLTWYLVLVIKLMYSTLCSMEMKSKIYKRFDFGRFVSDLQY